MKKPVPTRDFQTDWYKARVAFERDKHGAIRPRMVAYKVNRLHWRYWRALALVVGSMLWRKVRRR